MAVKYEGDVENVVNCFVGSINVSVENVLQGFELKCEECSRPLQFATHLSVIPCSFLREREGSINAFFLEESGKICVLNALRKLILE